MAGGLALLAVLLMTGGAGAATYEYEGANPPRYLAANHAQRPRLALALGGGGRRGFAHAGVLRALENAGVKPDLIVGVSIGSVIGALYAAGTPAAEVERLALELDLSALRDWSWFYWGWIRGQKLQDFVNARVRQRPLEALGIRFAVVASRDGDGAMQIFNAGDTGVAVRASSAVAGRFYAVRIGGVTYVDGDVASPVPVLAARRLGAQVVVAVDISAWPDRAPASVPADWLQRDRERRAQIDAETPSADVLIHPDLGYYAGSSASYRRRVIAVAAESTRAALPKIRAAMANARDASPVSTRAAVPAASPAPQAPR